MDRKLAALVFLFKLAGHVDFTKFFMVRQALKDYCKGSTNKDSRHLVSFSVLGLVLAGLEKVCSSGFEWILFRATFLLAFFGAFRISELVSPSKWVVGGFRLGAVQCSDSSVKI